MKLKSYLILVLFLLVGTLSGCFDDENLFARAGDDQTVTAGASVTLTGSAVGGVEDYTYTWALTGNPDNVTVSLSSATAARPTFTAPATPTVLTFTLTVTDGADDANTDTDEVTITVVDPLSVDAGADQTVNVGSPVTLTATASGGVGGNRYAWLQTSGSPGNISLTADDTAALSFTAPDAATTLVFSLTVTDTDGNEAIDTVTVNVRDMNPPTAEAGDAQTVNVGTDVTLDGSGSSDDEGTVTYAWTVTSVPTSATVTLTGDDTARPTFTAPARAATLTFTLTVTDEAGNQATDTVTITVDNNRPTANAGDGQTVAPNTQVTLNGSGASNSGGSVTYLWSQSGPSTLTLSSNTDPAPTFTSPAATGTYTLTLTVTDSGNSLTTSDSVTIIVDATAPTAEAGAAQTVNVGANVTLDGTASTDSEDATALTYAWALTASDPAGASIDLTNATSAEATFTTPDLPVELTFTLTVTDGGNNEDTDTVIITVEDQNNPTANAGADQTVSGGETVNLDGSGSSDGEGAIATWQWSHESGPAASLSGGDTSSPSFTAPNTAGDIVLELTVTDEAGNEAITVDALPVAEAGADQAVPASSTVTLDGSGSTDVVDDGAGTSLTYSWALTGDPDTTGTALTGGDTASPTFTAPSTTTTLTFTLTVTDSAGGSHMDTVMIAVDATDPTAEAGADQTVNFGAGVTLDGSGSSDGQSSIASYSWALTASSPTATVTLTGEDTAAPTFTAPDTAGTLTFTLTVTDEGGNMATDTVMVTVQDGNAPTADAGDAQTVAAGTTVTLDASGSSDDEGAVTYSWALTASNPTASVTLSDITAAMPTFTHSTAGTLTFTLTVLDQADNRDTDTVTITVDALPVAEAGDDQLVMQGTSVTLDGSASSDNEGAVTYSWALTGSNPTASVTLSDSTAAMPTFTAPGTAGTLTFTLTVTDTLGSEATDTVVIIVHNDTEDPTAAAGDDRRVSPNSEVTLDGTGSLDNAGGTGVASYTWSQPTGYSTYNVSLAAPNTATPTFTPATPGRFTFRLTVEDAAGNPKTGTSSDTVAIIAADATDRVILSKGTAPGAAGEGAIPIMPVGIVVDSDRALLSMNDTILRVNLDSGDRSVFSTGGSNPIGSGSQLSEPRYMALDSGNNRLLVTDGGFGVKALFAVALDDGDRTVLSSSSVGSGTAFDQPWGIALDSSNNRVFVADDGLNAIVAVSLASGTEGNRTIFSQGGGSAVGTGDAFDTPVGVVLDSANERLLVADAGLDAIVAVSLASGTEGNRTILSRGDSTPDDGDDTAVGSGAIVFDTPRSLVLDSTNNRLLVADAGLDAIVAVALDTGNRTIYSQGGESPVGGGVALVDPHGMAYDSIYERLLVVEQQGMSIVDGGGGSVVSVYLTDAPAGSE